MYRMVSIAIVSAALVGMVVQANAATTDLKQDQSSSVSSHSNLNAALPLLASFHSPLRAPEKPFTPDSSYKVVTHHAPLRAPEKPFTPDGLRDPQHAAPANSFKVAPHWGANHVPGQPDTLKSNSVQRQTTPDGSYKVATHHSPI